jgi:hypothetical protein
MRQHSLYACYLGIDLLVKRLEALGHSVQSSTITHPSRYVSDHSLWITIDQPYDETADTTRANAQAYVDKHGGEVSVESYYEGGPEDARVFGLTFTDLKYSLNFGRLRDTTE